MWVAETWGSRRAEVRLQRKHAAAAYQSRACRIAKALRLASIPIPNLITVQGELNSLWISWFAQKKRAWLQLLRYPLEMTTSFGGASASYRRRGLRH
jgi:hypothetical protein